MTPALAPQPIVVVDFVESGQHHEVRLYQESGRANATNCAREKTRDNAPDQPIAGIDLQDAVDPGPVLEGAARPMTKTMSMRRRAPSRYANGDTPGADHSASECRKKGPQLGPQLLVLANLIRILEVPRIEQKQLVVAGDRVVDRELRGRGHRRIRKPSVESYTTSWTSKPGWPTAEDRQRGLGSMARGRAGGEREQASQAVAVGRIEGIVVGERHRRSGPPAVSGPWLAGRVSAVAMTGR